MYGMKRVDEAASKKLTEAHPIFVRLTTCTALVEGVHPERDVVRERCQQWNQKAPLLVRRVRAVVGRLAAQVFEYGHN